MSRKLRSFIVAALVVGASILPPKLAAYGDESLGGYVMTATSGPVAFVFNSPSTGVPASPTGELTVGRTTTKVESGPTSYALASLLWPGDTAAGAGPAATGEFRAQFKEGGGPPEFADRIPDGPVYPVRAESFHPQGPEDQEAGAQGIGMTSTAHADNSAALARVSGVIIPAIVSAEGVTSVSRTIAEGGVAVAEAESRIRNLSILGGAIRASELTSTAKVTSDGVTATVEGTFHAADFSIASETLNFNGQGLEATIDGDTVKILGAKVPVKPRDFVAQASKALEPHGITVTLADVSESKIGARGERAFDGLIVSFKAGALEPYVAQLPDDIEERFRDQVVLDQVVTIAIGSVSVTTVAAPAYVAPPITPPVFPPGGTTGGFAPPAFDPPAFGPPGSGPVQPPSGGAPSGGEGFSVNPVAAVAVPAGLVGFVLALAALGALGSRKLADEATRSRSAVRFH